MQFISNVQMKINEMLIQQNSQFNNDELNITDQRQSLNNVPILVGDIAENNMFRLEVELIGTK